MTDPTSALNTIRDNVVLPIAARVPMAPALAQFLSDGLRTLGADAHDDVVAAIEAERGDIVLTIRPDKGEVLASLVARGDAAKPITLFGVRAADEVRH